MKTIKMKRPKVTLKKIRTFRGREGFGFNADVYIDGVKCLFVVDDGNGGAYHYETYHKDSIRERNVVQNIEQLKAFAKTTNTDLDTYIAEVFDEQEQKKVEVRFEKRKQKLQEHAILFGVPGATTFQYLNFNVNLRRLKLSDLQARLDEVVQKYCKDGIKVLNTNLAEIGLRINEG